jgi:alpha-galactosidase/6-phospho-beta-glucosidase family protein
MFAGLWYAAGFGKLSNMGGISDNPFAIIFFERTINMINICILGSSLLWSPTLVTDLMAVFPEQVEVRFNDINPEAAELCRQWGIAASKALGRKDQFLAFTDRRHALRGADAVLITLSTGGLDAMEQDIVIPERYGIYATVGDTAGPGGWSRSIRNIPVFMEFAKDFEELCPTAFIANYTNPMSSLTATLCRCCSNPVSGMCHSYFETKDAIQQIFDLPDWSKLSLSIAGMNHFTWVTGFNIGREDGYALLRRKIGDRSLRDVMEMENEDEIGYYSGRQLCVELYDAYGYLPFPADRHIGEFVSFALTGRPELKTKRGSNGASYETVGQFEVVRTPISFRRESAMQLKQKIISTTQRLNDGLGEMPQRSRETGADMIAAYLYNKPIFDAVNTLNVGQIDGLPRGVCVETMGTVDGMGVHPAAVDKIPDFLLEIMRPQAVNQKWVTDGVICSDKKMLLNALYNDPQCKHLNPGRIREMAEELFAANGVRF